MLIVGIILILAEQMKRTDPIKILSSTFYFVICFEFYDFAASITSAFILGPIMIFFFYETVERIDRYGLSSISYYIVGFLLQGKEYNKLGYTIVHWLVVRFALLYIVILPFLDSNSAIIAFSIIGLIIFVVTWMTNLGYLIIPSDISRLKGD